MLTLGIDDQEDALFNSAHHLVSIFAIAVPVVGMDNPVRVEKRLSSIRKIETTLFEAGLAFSFVPYKVHTEV